ncbi:Pro-Pol polyprotein [Smittium culicis]|uniref:Pro-Pol polyprotein n=1 Tax=Smittium culicis TaxID=133412 RepID=A0A1R1XC77_9FUNG|nr:Pro-Pol polyprotein [Smittium culicis]
MVEVLTGFPFAEATTDTTAVSAIQVLSKSFSIFGIPSRITIDRGTSFTSNKFNEYCNYNNIMINLLPAYQPEWAGAVEKLSYTVRYSITKSSIHQKDLWDNYLNKILFALRARVHSKTGYSPYFLFFGIEPNLSNTLIDESYLIQSKEARVTELDKLAASRFGLQCDRFGSSKVPVFEKQDLVIILNKSIRKESEKSYQTV